MTISGGFDPDDFMKSITDAATADAERSFAESIAAKARELGLTTAETIDIDLSVEGDPGGVFEFDVERIRAMANRILADG